jgi:hypothetical protein
MMVKSKKLRRHSGRVTARLVLRDKKDFIINECLEPQVYWDDWNDFRDGFRSIEDRTLLKNEFIIGSKYSEIKEGNRKIKLLIKRRIAKKKPYKLIVFS